MKIDRLQIKGIIKLIFVIVIGIFIIFLEYKESNKKYTENEKIYNKTDYINQTDINVQNIDKSEKENINEEVKDISKEEIFSLIDKGLKYPSEVESFIYSKEFFENDNLERIYYKGEYKDLNNYINIYQYKENKFEFFTLRNSEDYVWGYFLEESDEINGITYILIDKQSGRLKALNSNLIQVIVY